MDSKISELNKEQKLKVATFLEVRKVVEEVGENIQFAFSKQSMDLIAELVWRRLKVNGGDLEAFAKHAKRSTINSEDVKLLARRNANLKEHLGEMADAMKSKKDLQKKKPSKKDSTVQSAKDTPGSSRMAIPGTSKDDDYDEYQGDPFETDFEPKDTYFKRPDSPIMLSD